jgi:hypothetical protein
VIDHAAKITAINPSAAGFALEEMFGFMGAAFLATYLPRGILIVSFQRAPSPMSLRDELNSR